MAFLKVENVAIRGISGCVPKNIEENKDLPFYAPGEAEQVIEAIGIERRHVAPLDTTASDLCLKAAELLISKLGWEKESIDLLAFCTQNPDYMNHPDSFVVHEQLGLPESTMCLDFYHGCPGWVVSLSSIASMMSTGMIKRAIFLDGDTVSKDQGANNREERPLFGDAGSATALEFDVESKPMFFNFGTKSDEGKALARQDGAYRRPYTLESLKKDLNRRFGVVGDEDVYKMDSMDVFAFAITKVPKAIKKLCSEFEINVDEVDQLVLHQANKVILENIAKRMKIGMDKVPLSLRYFGNTTSVSIPLTLVTECASRLSSSHQKNLVCGFGTGLAWGAAYFETDNIICPTVIKI